MRPVRILHLIASNFVGGPESQILRHALDVTSPEREIWIGSFRDAPARPEILQRAEDLGLTALEFSSGRFNPRTVLELVRALRRKQVSLLCTHGYKANVVGWLASRLSGCPQIGFVRGWTAETWRVRQYERLDRFALARVDWVVCVSQPQAEQLGKKREGRHPPIVIPNAALFLAEDVVLPIDRRPIRATLGLPEDAFLVCAAGRLSVEKGQRYLIDASASLASRIPNVRVLVLGEGRERPRLEEQLAQLGLQNHVVLAGFKKNVRPWIQACDVLVNPSLTEGMPNVVLEAMALGTPVVATRVGGIPDLIRDQESGLLVAPGDATTLANAVCDLCADPVKARRLAQNAQARVREFSPESQQQRLLDLYALALEDSIAGKSKG
jgi:glycosyltransferase involved in cell wall biosynthesis